MSPSLFSLYDGKMPAYIFSFLSFGRWTFERLVVMEFDTLSDVYDTYKNGVLAKYFGDLLSDSGTHTCRSLPYLHCKNVMLTRCCLRVPVATGTTFMMLFVVNTLVVRCLAYLLLVFCNGYKRRPISGEWRSKHLRNSNNSYHSFPLSSTAASYNGATPLRAAPLLADEAGRPSSPMASSTHNRPLLASPEPPPRMEALEMAQEDNVARGDSQGTPTAGASVATAAAPAAAEVASTPASTVGFQEI